MFGPALKKVLGDEDLARRVDLIRVRSDAHFAEIVYDNGQISRFSQPSRTPLTWTAEMDGEVIAAIAALLVGSE